MNKHSDIWVGPSLPARKESARSRSLMDACGDHDFSETYSLIREGEVTFIQKCKKCEFEKERVRWDEPLH